MSKRFLLIVTMLLLPLNSLAADQISSRFETQIRELERKNGGRIGVSALNTATNQRLDYRGDERFALCSTFKLLLVAAVLARVDDRTENLQRVISYTAADILEYAPITRKNLQTGKMTIADLSAAAIQYSDNTAANLLFKTIGGPEGLTRYIRSLADTTTQMDRIEPDLNTNQANDKRDTTTPSAMMMIMQKLLIENTLSPSSKQQLIAWLIGNTTGDSKLRAGVNSRWKIGDKTGAGDNGASNDVAIIWPPDQKPLLVAAYYSESTLSTEEKNAVIAQIGRIVSNALYKK